MDKYRPASKIAEELLTRPAGATMDEIVAATGGAQYNVLKRLAGRGYRVRKFKQGRTTRYFAEPPAAPSFEATVTRQGQVTIPKEVRERLRLPKGGTVRFAIEADDRVVVMPAYTRLADLAGILGKPRRSLTLAEMDEAIADAAVERYRRAVGGAKR
jgi:AbrB family looped-hinge helix DNA binding protein